LALNSAVNRLRVLMVDHPLRQQIHLNRLSHKPGPPQTASSLSTPVEEALGQLTQSINLGTGLTHPSDKKHAVRVIASLQAAGHSFDPAEVRRWAQRNGWSSNAAIDLEAVARKR
jgi:hypothetical protein